MLISHIFYFRSQYMNTEATNEKQDQYDKNLLITERHAKTGQDHTQIYNFVSVCCQIIALLNCSKYSYSKVTIIFKTINDKILKENKENIIERGERKCVCFMSWVGVILES